MTLSFDHCHEMETIKLTQRFDGQVYFDVRPNKLIPIKIQLSGPLPPLPDGSSYRLSAHIEGLTHTMQIREVMRIKDKCKRCAEAPSLFSLGEGTSCWKALTYNHLTYNDTSMLEQGDEVPVKVSCCSVKHELNHFRVVFVVERVSQSPSGSPVIEPMARMALAPILSRKRAGKAPQAKPPKELIAQLKKEIAELDDAAAGVAKESLQHLGSSIPRGRTKGRGTAKRPSGDDGDGDGDDADTPVRTTARHLVKQKKTVEVDDSGTPGQPYTTRSGRRTVPRVKHDEEEGENTANEGESDDDDNIAAGHVPLNITVHNTEPGGRLPPIIHGKI